MYIVGDKGRGEWSVVVSDPKDVCHHGVIWRLGMLSIIDEKRVGRQMVYKKKRIVHFVKVDFLKHSLPVWISHCQLAQYTGQQDG